MEDTIGHNMTQYYKELLSAGTPVSPLRGILPKCPHQSPHVLDTTGPAPADRDAVCLTNVSNTNPADL